MHEDEQTQSAGGTHTQIWAALREANSLGKVRHDAELVH